MTFVKGYKMTDEHRKKISIALIGIKRSIETRRRISLANKKRMENPEFRMKLREAHKGKIHSEETKQKISSSNKGNPKPWFKGTSLLEKHKKKISKGVRKNLPVTVFKKGQIPWNKGKTGIYSKETLNKIREARIKQIFPKKDTYIEVLIQNELESRDILFEKHKVVFKYHQCDFFIKPNIVIECDGDYWHNLPEIKKRDKENNQLMDNKGYVVMRFWEKEIRENVRKCVDMIEIKINRK